MTRSLFLVLAIIGAVFTLVMLTGDLLNGATSRAELSGFAFCFFAAAIAIALPYRRM